MSDDRTALTAAGTPRLRVLILGLNYAPEPTGIAPYTTGTARFLAEAGHDVRVITGLPHYPRWEIDEGHDSLRGRLHRGGGVIHERDGDVRVVRVAHPVPTNPTGAGRIHMEATFARRAAALTPHGRRPDVVVAVSPALLGVGAALRWRRARRTAVGVVVQDLYGRAITEAGALSGRGAAAASGLERTLLRRADGVVAIHESFRRSLVALGVEPARLTTIRNWSHVRPVTATLPELRATRRALGWADDEVVALHAGNMGAKQGLENVVEAARLADATGVPVRFVLLGAGSQRARLERLGAGVERLQFLDPLPSDAFERAMAASDLLVLNENPDVTEMCVPSKLTSYFASGRPVVAATNAGSAAAAELTASGGGVRVEPGRPEALLAAVLRASPDGPGAATLAASGMQGRLFAEGTLSESAARAAYVAWVEGLAAARTTTPAPAAMPPVEVPTMRPASAGRASTADAVLTEEGR